MQVSIVFKKLLLCDKSYLESHSPIQQPKAAHYHQERKRKWLHPNNFKWKPPCVFKTKKNFFQEDSDLKSLVWTQEHLPTA